MFLIDMHCDTISKLFNEGKSIHCNKFSIDIEKLRKADSIAQFFAAFIDIKEFEYDDAFERCKKMLDLFCNQISLIPSEIKIALSNNDLCNNMREGIISAFLTLEEGGIIQNDIKKIDELYDLGIRLITLTWNYPNSLGYPNFEGVYSNNGLTEFGIEVITKMNEKGIIIDVSHLSDAGFWDVARLSSKPFVASHSNARDIKNHMRNLNIPMIKKIAECGGIIGINFCNDFVGDDEVTKIEGLIKHIDFIKNCGGIDVLAIGSDFDGISNKVEFEDISGMGNLSNALIVNGYTISEVEKIFYKNAIWVISDVLK